MTALNTSAPRPTPSFLPTIRPLAHSTHPEEHQIQVSVACMMGIDYVFFCGDDELLQQPEKNQEIMRFAFQICEELELTPDSTMFILAELNCDALEDSFSQCRIRWVDGYPIELSRQPVSQENQIEYLQTILDYSSRFKGYMI